MIIEITNSYHGTMEIVEEESLEVAKNKHISGLEVTAGNLAENEVEDDWADYYATYEEAEQATYDDILNQLKSEVAYKVIEQPMTIREVMASVTEYKDEASYKSIKGEIKMGEKTQEQYYQELVNSIITKEDFIALLVTNFNNYGLTTTERLAIEEFTTNWAGDFKEFSD